MRRLPTVRLWFLGLVNALIALHVVIYYFSGRRSVGCIDFFGLATFLGKGQITAGTIFIGVTILLTLVLGRVFCGWGCHFGLFQDLLAKGLRRIGVRTPFRRSWLEFAIPPILFAVTLIYPIATWWREVGAPDGVTMNIGYPDVWHLLPGLKGVLLILAVDVVVLTLLCGDRAFCRYVCPYGLFLKFFHALSPARIVKKTSPCKDCNACTRSCPTGVLIKHEVESFGVIRDLNCMNCGDCTSACPENALSFKLTRRAYTGRLARTIRTWARPSWADAVVLGAVIAGLVVYRGQEYGDFLAAGMGLTVGTLAIIAVRPARYIGGRGFRLVVRKRARLVSAVLASYLIVGLVGQYLELRALSKGFESLSAGESQAVLQAYNRGRHLAGVFRPFTFYLDDFDDRALKHVPRLTLAADTAMKSGNWSSAESLYRASLAADPRQIAANGNLGAALLKQGRYWPAVTAYLRVLEYDPDDLVALYQLAIARIQLGQLEDATRIVKHILSVDTVGHAYDLISENPVFQLLNSEPDYHTMMATYHPYFEKESRP